MRERLSDYQEMYGDLYNLEATPAESTAYRLAKHDVERWPDIITASSKDCGTPYYTNSSHLPVGYTEDIFTALDVITYSVKPNIYMGTACRNKGILYFANVQGLGTAFEKPLLSSVVSVMYRSALRFL